MNTGSKKSLGVSDSVDCAAESASKLNDVLGRTVGQGVFGLGPHELVRVKLRGIGREPMHMEALVAHRWTGRIWPWSTRTRQG